jgi:arsenite methyltransferase
VHYRDVRPDRPQGSRGLGNAQASLLPFDEQTFDVVVSSMALHNIPGAAGRTAAIDELARVLKPGGRVAILDYRDTGRYAAALAAAGLGDVQRSRRRFGMYPPVRVVTATKLQPPTDGESPA